MHALRRWVQMGLFSWVLLHVLHSAHQVHAPFAAGCSKGPSQDLVPSDDWTPNLTALGLIQ